MPAPKKFLSKAERQIAGRDLEIASFKRKQEAARRDLQDRIYPKSISQLDPEIDEALLSEYPILGEYFERLTQKELRGGKTRPSSQVKKAKMSEQKLTKIGDAINTGLTPERAQVLRLLSKLPREQMAKIFKLLTEGGYAME